MWCPAVEKSAGQRHQARAGSLHLMHGGASLFCVSRLFKLIFSPPAFRILRNSCKGRSKRQRCVVDELRTDDTKAVRGGDQAAGPRHSGAAAVQLAVPLVPLVCLEARVGDGLRPSARVAARLRLFNSWNGKDQGSGTRSALSAARAGPLSGHLETPGKVGPPASGPRCTEPVGRQTC
jgi:hypothetical protein